VAVVDEAVLALTGFKTPTLEALTRFDRPLGVFTGELRSFLIHQTPFYLSRNDPLTGGGGLDEGMISKLRRRFEAVAYFNPRVLTDAQGRAQVTFTLPDNMTTYRIYTVVLDRGSRFASAERPLLATQDFYLEPGMPGFFTRGDRFKFQVAAFNATDARGPVKFGAVGDGGLFLAAAAPQDQLIPKDSIKLDVTGQAAASGPAGARFTGEFQGRTDAVELKLRINSGHVRDTRVWFGSLAGAADIKVPLPGYLTGGQGEKISPEEVKAVLTVAGSPFLRMTEAIHYLLTYPYGCVEQTSSGVLGLAALRGAIEKGLVSGVDLADTDKYLNRGVQRILGMQTDSGGFAYWPGQQEAHVWGSIYAAAALSLARTHGLTVPEDSLGRACDYLKTQIKEEKRSPAVKAFAAYVLALNEALDRDLYHAVSAQFVRMNRESKILVLLAASQGELRPVKELQAALKPLLGGKAAAAADDADEFQARFRTPALALLAAQAIMPQDHLTREEALLLLGGLDHQGIWTSTSDTGWALLALGEYFKDASFGAEPVEIDISQPGVAAAQRLKLDPAGFRTVALDPGALLKNPQVKVEGQAGKTWLYKLELTAPRLDIAGAGAANGFKVRRLIKNTDGTDVIKVGDLVKVTVFLEVAGKGQRYVVLDDPLPAGLMALNTAFKTEEPLPEGDDSAGGDDFDYVTREGTIRFRPNYFEIRDDRVLAFRDQVYAGPHRFEYYCRAVCEGQFVAPATRVAAMYSPGVNGFSPQGELTVKGR